MEYWNLYDYQGNKKKKMAMRGSKLNNDEFHLVINAWIMNDKGEFLITQRALNRSHPLMWECTGGSALYGETSLDAAIREIKEELGITIDEKKVEKKLIGKTRRFYESCPDILDVWLFKVNVDIKDVVIQEEEVNDVMWASKDTILSLYHDGKFEANAFFNRVLEYFSKPKVYYVGFNANNAICNEMFFDGAITLNPNHEKGNIYYTTENVKDKNSKAFLDEYKKYLVSVMKTLVAKDKNTVFLAFNKKIHNLLKDEKDFQIISEKDYSLIDKLNDKKYTRNMLSEIIPTINGIWINEEISYEEAIKNAGSKTFVIQGKTGSGGTNTYFIDNKDKFSKYSDMCNHEYYLSKYIKHLPLNITIVIGDTDTIILPTSVQLISLENDIFRYVGGDFIYAQKLDVTIRNKINDYSKKIVDLLKSKGYRGILGIDYIVDEDDQVYFMEINPRFQSSSFLISNYLEKSCSTTIAELHYLAITGKPLGSNYIDRIDNSFLNCTYRNEYDIFKYKKIIKNGYYYKNKSSNFRKVYPYSIVKFENFEKRDKD